MQDQLKVSPIPWESLKVKLFKYTYRIVLYRKSPSINALEVQGPNTGLHKDICPIFFNLDLPA